MASEIRVDKINSLSGVGTVTLSPTGVDISGITTAATLKATTGIVTTLTATTGIVTTLTTNTTRATTGIVTTLTATTGIVTTLTTNTLTANSTAKVGSGVTLSPDGDVFVTGVTTSSTVKVGGGVTITESGIEASGIGITCDNINGGQIGGRRNLIINGAMQVAQRGTSFTASGGYTLDRWRLDDAMSAGGATITQSTTSPDGFSNSLKVDITSADTSVAAGEYAQFYQYIEAQNLQHLAYGTSAAKTVTLSFYVRSNKTGGYNLAILQSDASSRLVSFQYTINSADTWERKSFTIPGDASGQIDNDNGIGYSIFWGHAYGTNYTSGSLQSTFSGYSASNFGAGQAVNLYDSTSNEWYITGVQLEVGSQATPFEHRSFGEELSLCQRYFCKSYRQGVDPGAASSAADIVAKRNEDYSSSRTDHHINYSFPMPMRATPTLAYYSYDGTSGKYTQSAWDFGSSSNKTISGAIKHGRRVISSIQFGQAPDAGQFAYFHFTATAEL